MTKSRQNEQDKASKNCDVIEHLLEQRYFRVPEEKMKAFLEALDQPPQPKPRMKRLLSEPSLLEGYRD